MIGILITIILLSIVLGMDALSLAMGLGLRNTTENFEKRFILTVGILHVLMPLIGLNLGLAAGRLCGVWASRLGALVLLYLGGQMLYKAYAELRTRGYKFAEAQIVLSGNSQGINDNWSSILILALSVSIDALTVSFTLGTLKMPIIITVFIMGFMAAAMTWIGFAGGRALGRLTGSYAQIMAGIVLLALAIKFML